MTDTKIEYHYLDVDNKKLYDSQEDLIKALRGRGTVLRRAMPSLDGRHVLYAGGSNPFTESEAVRMCLHLLETKQ